MCEFLIRAAPAIGSAPAHWQPGDIVVVMPDGHAWGREENLPRFYILKAPGLSVAKGEALVTSRDGIERSTWNLSVAEFTTAVRSRLSSVGILVIGTDVTRATVEARLRRKDTNATASLV